ncbi:hypothetical protein AB0B45_25405 [Nonomuraea sp. NPDC049152]|uniref:hypothetical protein n=1 Tax=Nonomuraea sp. NPDC049152 TaxID=3154350 RepID=UPI0033D72B5C
MQASLLDRVRLFTGLVPGSTACRRTAAHIWGLNALSESEDEWPVELAVPRPAHVQAAPSTGPRFRPPT